MVSQSTCLLLLVSVLSTSPLPTSADTTSSNTAGCIPAPIWTRFNNTGVFGGDRQTNAPTIEACQASCIASSNCIAIDFDSTDGCFFIPTNNNNDKVTRKDITHFDLTRQTCPTTPPDCIPAPIWTRFNNTGVFGGNPQTNAPTLEACRSSCIASSNCIAIDFSSTDGCFLIPTSNTNEKVTRMGLTHFDLTRQTCRCLPAPIWTRFDNTSVFGGNPQTTASTILACRSSCIASSNCIGVDFDSIAGCFFIPINNTNVKVTRAGVTHYDLTRPICPTTPPGLIIDSGFYSIWYLKTGGVLSIDPNTQVLNVVEDIIRASWLIASPCIASSNSDFRGGANCISLSPVRDTGSYMRFLLNGSLIVDTPTNQLYPQRFNEDTSFNTYTNALFSSGGFTSVQPAINAFNSYLTGTVNSSVVMLPRPTNLTLTYNNSASFVAVSTALPTAPISDSCPNVWTRTSGARLPLTDLLLIGVSISQALCRQRCIVYPGCVGISYQLANRSCSLALNSVQSDTALVADRAYIHYDLMPIFPFPCARGCAYTWTLTTANLDPSTYSLITSAVNYLNCRIACVSNVNCVGVIWSSSSSSVNCSLIISSTGNIVGGTTTVSYYTLARTFVSCGPCSLTVYITANATDSNAVLALNTRLRGPCRTACVNNPLCTGFNIFDRTCSLSFTSSPSLTSSNGGYHVDIIRSPCGNGCIDRWDFYVSTTGVNATAYPAATTELACRQVCQVDDDCYSFDWNSSLQKCMFSELSNVRIVEGSSPGWNHYEWNDQPFCDADSP